MTELWIMLYVFLGHTPDGLDHWQLLTIGPTSEDRCRHTLYAAMGDSDIGPTLMHDGAASGCLHEQTLQEFVKGKGCKLGGDPTKLEDGTTEQSYTCEPTRTS